MLTTHPSSIPQKRDLHVGGLGSAVSGAWAPAANPTHDAADSMAERVLDAARKADDYVHDNPWTALAVAALLGVAAGYLLSRRGGR
jgi:ElaB/YqjD/DUF883 family membrane-anchored ribosome-binding protein